ncbi:hypothetical protein FRC12_022757 [Ceratobasidium sp. 428]|nr:hypothetical protein FRC12_022757 [Ceratobasidium sp. 428]
MVDMGETHKTDVEKKMDSTSTTHVTYGLRAYLGLPAPRTPTTLWIPLFDPWEVVFDPWEVVFDPWRVIFDL